MVELITGSMFGGKTLEAIKRIALHPGPVVAFVHKIDTRSVVTVHGASSPALVTHSGLSHPATRVGSVDQMRAVVNATNPRLVCIDEVQFFDEEDLYDFVKNARALGTFDLVLVGLLHKADGRTFATTCRVLSLVDRTTSLHAACTVCRLPSTRSQWLGADNVSTDVGSPHRVGGAELYEPRCVTHWRPA